MFAPHNIKRWTFMFCTMFPILLILNYKGYDLTVFGAITACISSSVAFILFPDPKFLQKIKEEEKKESETKKESKEKKENEKSGK